MMGWLVRRYKKKETTLMKRGKCCMVKHSNQLRERMLYINVQLVMFQPSPCYVFTERRGSFGDGWWWGLGVGSRKGKFGVMIVSAE